MKVLLVSTNFSPELTGIGKYSSEMVSWLEKQGHKVRVICSQPYYPQWKIHQGYSSWKYNKVDTGHMGVYRCPIWIPAKPSGLKRILHLFSFFLSSFPVVVSQIFWKPDIVISIEPSLLNSFGALLTAKISKANSILHIQDLEVEAAFNLGLIKGAKLKKVVNMIECFIMRRFDRVSTISLAMIEKVIQKGVDEQNVFLFPNWVSTKDIFPISGLNHYRKVLNLNNDTTVALYSGNIGEKQGLELVIEAAKELKRENIVFVLCGDGAAAARLKKLSEGMPNIIWQPLQPIEKLNQLLNFADIHLLPQLANAADLLMPSKLTGMLASGKPVIATASPGTEIHNVLKNIGVVIEPGSSTLLSEAINNLHQNPEMRQLLGQSGRKYAEQNLDYDAVMKNFEQTLFKLQRDNN